MNITLPLCLFVLVAALGAHAQSALSNWSNQFDVHKERWPARQIVLFNNQPKYSPGDTVWVKAYFFEEDFRAVKGKQLLELNLVDYKGRSIINFLAHTQNGSGQSQMVLPDTLSAGYYFLVAHSSWSRNFDPPQVFRKELEVVRKNTVLLNVPPSLQVAVEGGALVGDVVNRVYVHSSVGEAVRISDEQKNIVANGVTDEHGLIVLAFTPDAGHQYSVSTFDAALSTRLLKVQNDGCVLNWNNDPKNGPSVMQVSVSIPPASRYSQEDVFLFVTQGKKIVQAKKINLTSGPPNLINFLSPDFNPGIASIYLLSSNAILAHRNIYIADTGPLKSTIALNKEIFTSREEVSVDVQLRDSTGKAVTGEFLVSVLNNSVFPPKERLSMLEELIWNAVNNQMVRPFTPSSASTQLNAALVFTTDVRPWNTSHPAIPLSNAIQKNGRVLFGDTKLPLPDFTQVVFYLQREKFSYQTFTVDKGKVGITLPDFYGEDEFLYAAESKDAGRINDVVVAWESDTLPLPASAPTEESDSMDMYATFFTRRSLINKSYGFYTANAPDRVVNEGGKEIGKPDVVLNVQNYILFQTMEELMKELIPSLYTLRRNKQLAVRMKLLAATANRPAPVATSDPVYIIDGIATHDTNLFLSLKPADVLSIKLIKHPRELAHFKLLGKNGVVIVTTKTGSTQKATMDPSKKIIGLNPVFEFQAHRSVGSDPRRPDFRSTLFWNPSIHTDEQGRASFTFSASDDIGKMTISISGFTSDGIPFSAEKEIVINEGGP